jgi:alkylated DNA repair dioxygenase AlkB
MRAARARHPARPSARARHRARRRRPVAHRADARDGDATAAPSAAQRINDAKSARDILAAADALPLPTDASLAPHESQLHHRKKRKKTCSHALRRLAKMLVGVGREDARRAATRDASFARLVAGALWIDDDDDARHDDEASAMFTDTARALGSLAPFAMDDAVRANFYATAAAATLEPRRATVVAWALARCGSAVPHEVEIAMRGVPFRFQPYLTTGLIDLETLKREVPFKRERLTTRDGRRVDERRETCWMGEAHVGSYAYSGKVMRPVPMCPAVARVRDALEAKTGERFDCALINLYPSETAACAYHTDPFMGIGYATDSIIVSVGETRRFSFRPLGSTDAESHWIRTLDGDAIWMFANCQDDFEHCVMRAEGEGNDAPRASIVFKRSLKRKAAATANPKKKKSPPPSRGGRGGGRTSTTTRRER